jgi:hypothetical protein
VRQNFNTITRPVEERTVYEHQHSAVPSHRSITTREPDSQPRISNKAEQRHGIPTPQHTLETSIQPGSSRTYGLTRTTRKAYFEEKKSLFAPFGWNDSDRNIGQKKTYNVYAPETEVCLLQN